MWQTSSTSIGPPKRESRVSRLDDILCQFRTINTTLHLATITETQRWLKLDRWRRLRKICLLWWFSGLKATVEVSLTRRTLSTDETKLDDHIWLETNSVVPLQNNVWMEFNCSLSVYVKIHLTLTEPDFWDGPGSWTCPGISRDPERLTGDVHTSFVRVCFANLLASYVS